MPHNVENLTCNQWLAFELSVLSRLQFRSVALPWMGAPACALQLKRRGVRVHANGEQKAEFISAQAYVENNTERLTAEDIELIITDAYVPRHGCPQPDLRRWFSEPEAWWFSNVRAQIEKLDTAAKRALALDLGLKTGGYAFSFDDETSHLRLPLTVVIRRLWEESSPIVDNNQANTSHRQPAGEFLAEQQVDLALIRLPRFSRTNTHRQNEWHDVWLEGHDTQTADGESKRAARTKPASRHAPSMHSKTQFLSFIEELLSRAAHLPQWAIVHAADGYLTSDELVETVRHVRAVKTIYTKDFSEWMGVRTSIITT